MEHQLTLDDVDRFLADRAVQGAIDASRESQPLQICYPTELPVSRFLAWLFDPTQGHCLGAAALRALLTACWESGVSPALDPALRGRLAPSALAQLALADVLVEREVTLTQDAGRLDVLILLPRQRVLVAIENKTGSRQAPDQLERYRAGLKARFKDWEHVLVFLDLYGAAPNDDRWIGLQYDWLIEELRVAEAAAWLGEEPRRAIVDFRRTLSRLSGEEVVAGLEEANLLAMVNRHRAVFRQMRAWMDAQLPVSTLAAQLYSKTAAPDPAAQALFPMYASRRSVWRNCIPLVDYAALRLAALSEFSDLLYDEKHTGSAYFSLGRWDKLRHPDSGYWPYNVCVWENLDSPQEGRFVVESNTLPRHLAHEYKAGLQAAFRTLRATLQAAGVETGSNRPRITRCATFEGAAAALRAHMKEMAACIDRAQRPG